MARSRSIPAVSLMFNATTSWLCRVVDVRRLGHAATVAQMRTRAADVPRPARQRILTPYRRGVS
jgi:hypothetical protein